MKFLFLSYLLSFAAFANFDHSHALWNQVLKKYTVKKESQVYFNYSALNKEKTALNSYLNQMESVTKDDFAKFSDKQKLAFWINAYNAYTIQIVLKHYPIKSIKEIKSGWFSSGPWKMDFINLLGRKMSLDNIEHDTIRKDFNEARIHFAVNCASIGCPSLLQEAFVAQKLDQQLNVAALQFLQNKSKNNLKDKTLYLSKIFDWYGDDFNKTYGGYKEFVIKALKLPKAEYKVEFLDYDWNLNSHKKNISQ